MEYLKKKFTIAVSEPSPMERFLTEDRWARKAPRPGHEYVEVGGMCYECALGRQGHDEKWGKKK